MGIIELDTSSRQITIQSDIITYGHVADYEITRQLSEEIETMWNEADGSITWNNRRYSVRFSIGAQYNSLLLPQTVHQNVNPKNNYIRIEEYAKLNISTVDAIGSNTGYFLLGNLYKVSTTAAHEYGHSLGLDHPAEVNMLGKGVPGIMYPRGTLVDPEFQYDINVRPGEGGGTLNPVYRKVKQEDIDHLRLDELLGRQVFVIGKFTNKYHEAQVRDASA